MTMPVFDSKKTTIEFEKLEIDILEHLAKIFNQREISLLEAFREIDHGRKGFLDYRDFAMWLASVGLKFEDERLKLLFDIFDSSGTGKLTFTSIESKMM